ncbi:MAG: nucleoside deaminase [Phycisphaerales bacterium]
MMERAFEIADGAARIGEVPVGAVVYRTSDGEVLGEGANTRERLKDPMGHAEMSAIGAASRKLGDWRLNGCTLVVTLEPCLMCAGACINARVGRVVYGASDPKAGAAESLYAVLCDPRLNHRPAIIRSVRAAESAQRLRAFFRSLRK